MKQKLLPIISLLRLAVDSLKNKKTLRWFLISGLVFTVISRILVLLSPFLFVLMQTTEQTGLYVTLIGISLLLTCYISVFSFALFLIVSRHIAEGEAISLSISMKRAHQSVGRTLWTLLVFGVAVFVGSIALIIPGIIVAVWFFLAPTVSVLGVNKKHPFKQSKRLVKGRFFAILLRLIIIQACVMVPSYLLSLVHPLISQMWTVTTPFFSYIYTLFYLDIEKKEAV